MLLREYLKEWTKEDLLNEARSYELKNCSRLKKDDLIDRIVEYLTTEEALRGRLSCLTKEQMVLFCKACTEPQKISAEEIMDGMQLYKYVLGSFEEVSDCFTVFEEIAQGFSGIDDEAFRAVQSKKGWLMKCISFFIDYYEIAPLENWVGHSIREIDVRNKYHINILGVKESGVLKPLPGGDYRFTGNEHLLAMAAREDAKKLLRRI